MWPAAALRAAYMAHALRALGRLLIGRRTVADRAKTRQPVGHTA
ncbi:MAG: hypothetical protein R3F55_20620 [Alphaproteobacteria bacterium]